MKSDPAAGKRLPIELRDLLVCPQCKGPLTPNAVSDTLDCCACRLRYEIRRGIPILVVEEAAAY